MNLISETDKSYIAGLVDGEGCFNIYKMKNKSCKRGYTFVGRMFVTNCDLNALVEMRELTGLGSVRKRTPQAGRKQSYNWDLSVLEVKEIVPHIFPYMRIKKRQAELMMSFLNTHQWGRRKGFVLEDSVVESRKNMYDSMASLNFRGVR